MMLCLKCRADKPPGEFPDEGNWCNECLYRILQKEKKRGERIRFDHKFEITAQEWESIKRQHGYRCVCCQKQESRNRPLRRDHVIPYSKGGSPSAENIQPLCPQCNSKKGVKELNFR